MLYFHSVSSSFYNWSLYFFIPFSYFAHLPPAKGKSHLAAMRIVVYGTMQVRKYLTK